jgi:hypothetical protein
MTEKIPTEDLKSLGMSLDITNFKNLCLSLTPEIAIMVRGRHGIGKSQIVYQIARDLRDDFYKDEDNCKRMVEVLKNEPGIKKILDKNGGKWHYELGIPVIERRLSQMTEGDIIGLPLMEGVGTEFKPVTWLINSCNFPVVLFLDELNRAIKGVEQATFQLADSKAFYGNLLHSGTRIYIAVNIGSAYAVEDFDPAAISRCAVVDLEPSVDEFLAYAREVAEYFLPEFISINRDALEHKQAFEANKKYPDRRAWIRLDQQLRHANLYNDVENLKFLHISAAMVGFHYGNMYWDYCKKNKLNVSGEDVAKNWIQIRHRMPKNEIVRHQKFVELSHRVGTYLKEIKIENDDAEKTKLKEFVSLVGPNIRQFFEDAPAETTISLWAQYSSNKDCFFGLHSHIRDVITKKITNTTIPKSQKNNS